jgi:hypothetical protein
MCCDDRSLQIIRMTELTKRKMVPDSELRHGRIMSLVVPVLILCIVICVLRFRIVVESFFLFLVCWVLVAAFRNAFSCCFFFVLSHAYEHSEVLVTEKTQLLSDV